MQRYGLGDLVRVKQKHLSEQDLNKGEAKLCYEGPGDDREGSMEGWLKGRVEGSEYVCEQCQGAAAERVQLCLTV